MLHFHLPFNLSIYFKAFACYWIGWVILQKKRNTQNILLPLHLKEEVFAPLKYKEHRTSNIYFQGLFNLRNPGILTKSFQGAILTKKNAKKFENIVLYNPPTMLGSECLYLKLNCTSMHAWSVLKHEHELECKIRYCTWSKYSKIWLSIDENV